MRSTMIAIIATVYIVVALFVFMTFDEQQNSHPLTTYLRCTVEGAALSIAVFWCMDRYMPLRARTHFDFKREAKLLAKALFFLDTWFYFTHRLFHTSAFLYRSSHYLHHRAVNSLAVDGLVNG